METSLKTGFAQILSCCPKKSESPKIWGGCSPPRPPGPYAYAWMARRQQNRAAQDSAVGRKILDRAAKSVTSCNVDSPETKRCDSFTQSKGGKLYLARMCSFLGRTRRLNLNVVRFYCLFTKIWPQQSRTMKI